MTWLNNEVLEGEFVRLEPMALTHVTDLQQAVADGESWKLWYAMVPTVEEMPDYVQAALAGKVKGDAPYVVRCKTTGQIIGTSRYYMVDAANKRALIGYTWYAESVRRTPINTEAKLLLLQNLFEGHGAIAVEFRTHFFNQTSRKAIERLGAKMDGILRQHMILKDGSVRDTVVYSIIAAEWPAVRRHLSSKLGRA
ncbi:MAG: GNAT family N-acetyltransferase [Gammaproteobacteria bacterium]|nr:GNAT family N-acetyltransferase [Gammaproteobacteria bacterium]MBU2057586.1 GNAT family N-acetyltransferase [Gammaproteobacteria bacterium]MBU2176346.1 GNAT family N-acetyltransferase [Gammaproteobacteria bacterium]MBU2245947.1 GNAT family N-acetyltransferase [Gammaproteobacteria bacterium]MBU2345478.1 GNAT family N-acetyltransferase [Gammaproteobacteria bacterium]